jgi:hypothetical protein
MRSLVWTNAFLGAVFVGLFLTSYVFRSTELIPESPPAIAQQITEIQDIEHLRKVALLLVRNGDEMVKKNKPNVRLGHSFFWRVLPSMRNFFRCQRPHGGQGNTRGRPSGFQQALTWRSTTLPSVAGRR